MRLKDIDETAFEDWRQEREDWAPKRKARPLPIMKKDEFQSSRLWQELRKKVLDFYGKTCMKCKRHDRVMQVDHIRPKSLYPEFKLDFRNMQVLCLECNKEKGQPTEDYRSRLDKLRFHIHY